MCIPYIYALPVNPLCGCVIYPLHVEGGEYCLLDYLIACAGDEEALGGLQHAAALKVLVAHGLFVAIHYSGIVDACYNGLGCKHKLGAPGVVILLLIDVVECTTSHVDSKVGVIVHC